MSLIQLLALDTLRLIGIDENAWVPIRGMESTTSWESPPKV